MQLTTFDLSVSLAVWPAGQSEGSLYPLQHDDETEGSSDRKGNTDLQSPH